MASNCHLPELDLPTPADVLAALEAILQALGITIPDLPNIPLPPIPCAKD